MLALVKGIDTVLLISFSSSRSAGEPDTLLRHDSHFCSPSTSTSLLFRRCFQQYEMGHEAQKTNDLLLQTVQ